MSIPGTSGFEAATLGDYRTRAGFYDRQQKANKPEDFPSVAPVAADPVSSGNNQQEKPDKDVPGAGPEATEPASYFLFS
ncbi:MAG: hypothetical protein E6X49_23370 [Leclercia adecarboxylata]|nr:hypothetical protein [Leclercia adecarboxylata]